MAENVIPPRHNDSQEANYKAVTTNSIRYLSVLGVKHPKSIELELNCINIKLCCVYISYYKEKA